MLDFAYMTLAQGQGGGLMGMILMIVGMFAILYLFSIKPQQKKQKQHQEMLRKLKAGDKVITTGGLYGVIASVKDKTFVVKIAENTKVEISRSSVAIHQGDDEGAKETAK